MTNEKQVQALKAHLALNVHNVESSIEFYKKLLGHRARQSEDGIREV